MVMEHLPPVPSPSQYPWRGFRSAVLGVGVLGSATVFPGGRGQAVNKTVNDQANAANNDRPFVAFFIRSRIFARVRCRLALSSLTAAENDSRRQIQSAKKSSHRKLDCRAAVQ